MVKILIFDVNVNICKYVDEKVMKGYYVNKEHFFRKVIGAAAFLIEGIIADTNCLRKFVNDVKDRANELLVSKNINLASEEKIRFILRVPDLAYKLTNYAVESSVFQDLTNFVEFAAKIHFYFNIICQLNHKKYSHIASLFESLINHPKNLMNMIKIIQSRIRSFFEREKWVKLSTTREAIRDKEEILQDRDQYIIDSMIEHNIFNDIWDFITFADNLCSFMIMYEPRVNIKQISERVFQLEYEP